MLELLERVNLDPAVPDGWKPVAPRLVRFLMAEGVVSGHAGGHGRGADYTEDHLLQILRYFRLRDAGFSVSQIAAMRHGEILREAVSVELAPGVVLRADRAVFGSVPSATEILTKVHAALEALSLPAPVSPPRGGSQTKESS